MSAVSAVSAVSADDVWACGLTIDSACYRGFVMRWDGAAWSRIPGPGGSRAVWQSVSALGSDDVWLVGSGQSVKQRAEPAAQVRSTIQNLGHANLGPGTVTSGRRGPRNPATLSARGLGTPSLSSPTAGRRSLGHRGCDSLDVTGIRIPGMGKNSIGAVLGLACAVAFVAAMIIGLNSIHASRYGFAPAPSVDCGSAWRPSDVDAGMHNSAQEQPTGLKALTPPSTTSPPAITRDRRR